jgi:hypothetical protein
MQKPVGFVLGFTGDDVVGAWQHWRLRMECARAFAAEGLPEGFGIEERPGEGVHLICWSVSERAARVLDRHGVGWRRFLIEREAPALAV